MRKILFALFALTAIVLVACSKEDQKNSVVSVDNGHKMTITTNGSTKTQFNGAENGIIWSTGDQLGVIEKVTGGADDGKYFQKNSAAGTTSDAGVTMSFNVTLDSHTGAESFQYVAVYPNTSIQSISSFANVLINTPNEQNPTATQYDKAADLLISQVSASVTTQPTNMSMAFARKIAIGKMTVKNLGSDEDITSVTFSAKKVSEDVTLAGRSKINFSTSTVDYGSSVQQKSITLNYSGKGVKLNSSEGAPVYFMCYPFALAAGDKFKVVVETATKHFEKEVTLTGAQILELQAGNVSRFGVNMEGVIGESKVDFQYSNTAWLTAQGLAIPEPSAETNLDGSFQTESPIRIFSKKNGASYNPRIYNSAGTIDLRVYNKSHLVIGSYNNKVITKIIFTGASELSGMTPSVGSLDATSKTWTGNSAIVDFAMTSTIRLDNIKVFYQDAAASDHFLDVPTTTYTVPYNATSLEFPFFVANAVDLEAASESTGVTSVTKSVPNGLVNVVFEANPSASPRNFEITLSSSNPVKSVDIIITQVGAPLNTISAVKGLYSDAAVPFTATLSNALVTVVGGNTFFMEDASGAIKGYFSGHGLAVGDKINGTVTGTLDKNSGNFQITALDYSEATVTHGNTVTPLTISASDLYNEFASYESRYVRVNNLHVSAASGKNLNITEDENLIIYNNSDLTLPVGSNFNAVGAATYYNTTTREVSIYSVAEADRLSIVPTITASNTTVGIGATVTISPTINSTGAVTYSSLNTDKATVNPTTGVVTGVAAGDATIRISVAANDYWVAGTKDITVTVTGGASYTLTFSSSTMGASVNNYTTTWDNVCSGTTWTLVNFNNNSKGWNYVKCGRKNNASVATITTKAVISEAISSVKLTIDAITADKVNSIKLYVATNSEFTENLQQISGSKATGEQTFTITSPTKNCYYKLEFDCASGASNGLVQVSKVIYTE